MPAFVLSVLVQDCWPKLARISPVSTRHIAAPRDQLLMSKCCPLHHPAAQPNSGV